MPARLPPYIIWRDGRPRFAPSAREQRLGFASFDLKTRGAFMTFEQAGEAGWPLYAEILTCRGYDPGQVARLVEAAKAGAALRLRPAGRPRKRNARADLSVDKPRDQFTVEELLRDWLAAIEAAAELSPDSIASYRKSADAIVHRPQARGAARLRREQERAATLLGVAAPARAKEPFAAAPVAAIGKIELHDFYRYALGARGHHMAIAMVAAFSAAYTWGGLSPKWRLGQNPRHALKLARPAGRIVIYSDRELRALDAAAAYIGRPSVYDSILLGVMTCQRQRDRLALADEGLIDGRRHLRQSKTRKLVAIKDTPMLAARLADAKKRVSAIMLRLGLRERPATIVVDETTGRAYAQDTYRHVFEEVRRVAFEGVIDEAATARARLARRNDPEPIWVLPPCPSLRHVRDDGSTTLKQDLDLRDTGVTWLARAGATMAEICAISGHSARSVQTIIEHYLGATAELADAGIDKLVAWLQREGIAV